MYELTIASLFIVFFSISDNYVGEVIGCKTRKLFMNNMLFKHISLIFFIYFAVNLTNSQTEHPFVVLKKTILLWLFYIVFIRMDTIYLGICISLLVTYFVIGQYKSYLKENDKTLYDSQIDNLSKITDTIEVVIFIPLILGFFKYYKDERKTFGKSFSFYQFILGHKKCK
jgi:hypothetical protein